MKIYYDSLHEGLWFAHLHPALQSAAQLPFPQAPPTLALQQALLYDRPDIVLTSASNEPLLVLERTVEVPSGHNVGQRFARLAAGAEAGVPVVYFGPYAARKHGGETAGPRYMNLRLFFAIDEMMALTRTPVTTIRWPVDAQYEIIHTPERDDRMRAYLNVFFTYLPHGLRELREGILASDFEREQERERQEFIRREVRNPGQYKGPPPSVQIVETLRLSFVGGTDRQALRHPETVLYEIGMNNIRSDPYTGMALLYAYLYCGGTLRTKRNLVLHFPNVSAERWETFVLTRPRSKTTRLYQLVADGILFTDGYVPSMRL